ncbi:MAG: MarR family transcriptional regulator [Alphaproteobacteria bacterium]|nr:MarR family transcriptional regulator [Alphaproteobacteria bacterium]
MPLPPAGVDDPATLEALRAYVKLLRAGKAVVARIEPRLAARGLTATQLGVLEAILHKGPLTQRELGRKVLTSAGNMTDLIDKLEGRLLVCRSRVAGDRRSVRVALTPAGRTLIEGLFPKHARDIAEAMGGLTTKELAELGRLLRKLGMAASSEDRPHLAPADAQAHLPADRSVSNE